MSESQAVETHQSATTDFIGALFAPTDIVEFRCIKSGPPREFWWKADAIDLSTLARLNADGYNIYAGANPRPAAGKKGDACINQARSVFVDLDNDTTVEQAESLIQSIGVPGPSIVVHSGHGVWLYWLLAEPCTDLKAWSAAQTRLIAAFNSDRTIKNPERIVRVPGFINHKEPAALAELIGHDAGRQYDLADILSHLPAPTTSAAIVAEYRAARPSRGGDTSVIAAFNAAHSAGDILTAHGYTYARRGYLYRPGKSAGQHSVELTPDGCSIHYSDNDPLNDHRFSNGTAGMNDAFDCYRLLKHGGDVGKAVRAAARSLGIARKSPGKAAAAKPAVGTDRAKVAAKWAKLRGEDAPTVGGGDEAALVDPDPEPEPDPDATPSHVALGARVRCRIPHPRRRPDADNLLRRAVRVAAQPTRADRAGGDREEALPVAARRLAVHEEFRR